MGTCDSTSSGAVPQPPPRGSGVYRIGLALSIRDHGEVGASPYYPTIGLEGLITCKLDPHDIVFFHPAAKNGQTPATTSYIGRITVGQPAVMSGGGLGSSNVKGEIALSASFVAPQPARVFALTGAAEHFAYLWDVQVEITAKAEYIAQAFLDEHHFSVQQIESLHGTLALEPAALPRGYAPGTHRGVKATLVADLDKSSASFRFHAFVEPGGSLSSHYSLDWHVSVTAPLGFA